MIATLQLLTARPLGLRLRPGPAGEMLALRPAAAVQVLGLAAAPAATLTLHSTPTASGADFDPADFDAADFKTT